MKVDFIIGRLGKGGAERVMVTLSNYFVERGHQVRLLTFHDSEDGYELVSKIERIRLSRNRVSNAKLNYLLNLIHFYSSKTNRPEIAISFLTFTNLSTILACWLRSVPIIVSEHNNHTFTPKPKWLLHLNWNYVYRLAKYVTVLTDFDVKFFTDKKSKVVVMPNPSSFKTLKSNTHIREKTIMAVGSLNRIHHKGFDNLILIMSKVLPRHPEWILKIVGEGDLKNTRLLKDLVQQHGLEKQVHFLGFRNDINVLMQKASIYILTSRFEGLPMVLLEAESQGMACIAYDCVTGPSNMITHENNGILVTDQQMSEMEQKLEELILNEKKRQELGNAAIKSLQNYSIEHIYAKWEKIIKEAIK